MSPVLGNRLPSPGWISSRTSAVLGAPLVVPVFIVVVGVLSRSARASLVGG